MSLPDEAISKACCADLYQSDLARLILGDTLHPGGLALTNRLGRLMDLKPGDWVADLASGRGTSAMAISRAFRCKVAGIEFGAESVAQAYAGSLDAPVRPQTFFMRADAEQTPIRPSSVDGVVCECSMSIFPNKAKAVAEVKSVLRPGGRFGLSDVTVEPDSLPDELNSVLGRVLCLADALSVSGYLDLLAHAGFAITEHQDASNEILALLDEIEGKLRGLLAWQTVSGANLDAEPPWLADAPVLITKVRQLVATGQLGYWLFVAEKSD